MDLDEWLRLAKEGTLPSTHAAAVHARLVTDLDAPRSYTMVHIIGLTGDERFRATLESLVTTGDHPDLTGLALKLLCRHWGDPHKYKDDLLRLMHSDYELYFGEPRQSALHAASDYIQSHADPDIVRVLLGITRDDAEVDGARCEAYVALARMAGFSDAELIRLSLRRFRPDRDMRHEVLDRAAEIAAISSAPPSP
jgi:hypothetical protein